MIDKGDPLAEYIAVLEELKKERAKLDRGWLCCFGESDISEKYQDDLFFAGVGDTNTSLVTDFNKVYEEIRNILKGRSVASLAAHDRGEAVRLVRSYLNKWSNSVPPTVLKKQGVRSRHWEYSALGGKPCAFVAASIGLYNQTVIASNSQRQVGVRHSSFLGDSGSRGRNGAGGVSSVPRQAFDRELEDVVSQRKTGKIVRGKGLQRQGVSEDSSPLLARKNSGNGYGTVSPSPPTQLFDTGVASGSSRLNDKSYDEAVDFSTVLRTVAVFLRALANNTEMGSLDLVTFKNQLMAIHSVPVGEDYRESKAWKEFEQEYTKCAKTLSNNIKSLIKQNFQQGEGDKLLTDREAYTASKIDIPAYLVKDKRSCKYLNALVTNSEVADLLAEIFRVETYPRAMRHSIQKKTKKLVAQKAAAIECMLEIASKLKRTLGLKKFASWYDRKKCAGEKISDQEKYKCYDIYKLAGLMIIILPWLTSDEKILIDSKLCEANINTLLYHKIIVDMKTNCTSCIDSPFGDGSRGRLRRADSMSSVGSDDSNTTQLADTESGGGGWDTDAGADDDAPSAVSLGL